MVKGFNEVLAQISPGRLKDFYQGIVLQTGKGRRPFGEGRRPESVKRRKTQALRKSIMQSAATMPLV
jgi:hypothetical protein